MTIRLGVAGVAHPHINTIFAEADARDDVSLVGIAEPDPKLRSEFAERYGGVPNFADHAEMLDAGGVDVVAVGAVFGHRGQVVADALRAGAHVLADKPLCTSRVDLAAIHREWLRSGSLLSVAFEKRFYGPTLAASELVSDGELGDLALVTSTGPHKLLRPQRPDWMFHAATYGGILNDLVVHDFDLLLQFTGATRGRVTGHTSNSANPQTPEFEDSGLAVVEIDGGAVAAMDAHWFNPEAAPYHGDYKMRLVGTNGTADLLWKDEQLIVATHQRPPTEMPQPERLRPAQNFFDALSNNGDLMVTASDALAATSLALAAQESALTGHVVAWDTAEFDTEAGATRSPP